MAAAFDLAANPFHLLGLSVRARREEVVEAHEDALADGRADESALARAQQAVLTPRTRTEAELSWLSGLPPAEAKKIVEGLAANRIAEADEALERLRGLDQANLAADLSARAPGKANYVTVLLEAYSTFRTTDALEMLKGLHGVSGFPMPDEAQVESGLSALRSLHAKAAVACITAAEAPGEVLTPIVESFRAGDDHAGQLLSLIIRDYDAWSEPHLAAIRKRIEVDIAACRDGGGPIPVDALAKHLADWDAISQPVQLLDEAKGHEEPRSKEVYEIVRDFCLWLANEKKQYGNALSICHALLETFPELPAVAAQLFDYIETLDGRVSAAHTVPALLPLTMATRNAMKQMSRFDMDLRTRGFGPNATGLAGSLYEAFAATAPLTAGTSNAHAPWGFVEKLEKDLVSQLNSPEGALALLEGLAAYEGSPPPPGFATKLETNRGVYRRLIKWNELTRSDSDDAKRLSAVAELLESPASEEEEAFLLQLKADLQRKKPAITAKRAFWWLAAAAAVGVVIYGANEEPSYSPGSSAMTVVAPGAPQSAAAPSASASSEVQEQKPPPGTDRLLSKSELRYCVFQGARLDRLRVRVTNNQEIDHFNMLVEDFNSHCGSFRYRPSTLEAVQAELAGKEDILREQALALLWSWPEPQVVLPPSPSAAPLAAASLLDLTDPASAKRVQAKLRSLGYYLGTADGLWGPASRLALRSFKSNHSLPDDDRWDLETQRVLLGR